MKNLMYIIMVVMTGNCMVAMPPDALLKRVSQERSAAVMYPIVRGTPKPIVIGSARWMAWRMLVHAQGQSV